MSEAFVFNPVNKGEVDPILLFWRCVRRYKIEGEKNRIALLRRLVSRKQAEYMPHPETQLKGKKILGIKKGDTK